MVHDDVPDNVAGALILASGDVNAALRVAPRVLTQQLRIARGTGFPMETRGVVADYTPLTDELRLWASTQVPHEVRRLVAEVLAHPLHRIRVVAPDVGGGFGTKLVVYPEDVLTAFLAKRCGRPVRWLEERLEHFRSATQEREQVHDVTVAFDAEGHLLALRDRFVHDTGAYTPRGLVVPLATASMLAGPYRVPNLEIVVSSAFTNRVPVTPYRGAGQPQAVFVVERVLDLVARATGRDPVAVRLANLVRPSEMPYDTGLPKYRGGGTVECGLRRPGGTWRLGVAAYGADELRWYNGVGVLLTPEEVLSRRTLSITSRRDADAAEAVSLGSGKVVVG
jgi:CO/xanthine dehydrogenase Mo-binding subunit